MHWHVAYIRRWGILTLMASFAEGALASETPSSPADLKIILSGKFLEANQVLDGNHICPLTHTPVTHWSS